MTTNDNIKVVIKARPLIKRERDAKLVKQWRIQSESIECTNLLYSNYKYIFGKSFYFLLLSFGSYIVEFFLFCFTDQICDEKSSTHDLYEKVAKPIVESSVNGFNGIFYS